MEYKQVKKYVERPTVKMHAVALTALVRETLPPSARPTVEMRAIVVEPSGLERAASAM